MAVVAVFVASWLWLSLLPPVQAGSVWAVIGEASECPPVDIRQDDETVPCHKVAFEEGASLGIGFTVRNSGPLAVAIESVEPIGLEPTALAVLRPELIDVDFFFGVDAGRPFEPVEVAPNSERAIQPHGARRLTVGSSASRSAGACCVRGARERTVVLMPWPSAEGTG